MSETEAEPSDWDRFRRLVSAETVQCLQSSVAASAICHYQVNVVPAPCQTPDYTRALMVGTFERNPDEVEAFLDLRISYRRALEGKSLPVRVLLDEAVVRRRVGGRDVMRRQVEELIQLDHQRWLDLRLVPFEAGAHVGLRGSFVHLKAADGNQPDVVYREIDGLDAIETGEPAERYTERFDRLWQQGIHDDDLWGFVGALWL